MRRLRPSRRATLAIAAGLASFVVVSLVAAWLLLSTGFGIRLALGYLRGRLAPATTIGAISGRLRSPLEIIDLRYTGGGAVIIADTVRIEWRLASLLRRELDVRRLRVSGIEVAIPDSSALPSVPESGAVPEPLLREVELPVSVRVPQAMFERIVVRRGGDTTGVTVDSVIAAVAAEADSIAVQRFELFGTGTRASATGAAWMTAPYSLAIEHRWEVVVRGSRVVGRGRLSGDMDRLELMQEVIEPVQVELVAELDSVLTSRWFTATLAAVEFGLQDIDSALAPARVGGELRASGTFSAFSADAYLRVTHAAIGRADSRILLSRRAGVWQLDSLDVGFRDHGGRVTGAGTVTIVGGKPTFDALSEWEQLGWPLVGQPWFTSSGRLRGVGTLDSYELDGTAAISGAQTPAGNMRVLARGNRDSMVVTGSGETLGGEVTLFGALGLTPVLDWDVEVEARNLNLAALLPDTAAWVRKVAVTASADGFRSDSGLVGTIRVRRLSGLLRETPFSLAGVTSLRPGRLGLDSARAELLGGELHANGLVHWDSSVEWHVMATASGINPAPLTPDPAQWNGTLSAVTQLAGSFTSGIRSAGVTIDTISGVLRGERIGAKGRVWTDGAAYSVDSLSVGWGSLSLTGSGRLSEQVTARLELDAPDLRVAVPGAAGSLRVEIGVDGARAQPTIVARLAAARARYQEYGADEVVGGGVLDLKAGGRFDFSIDAAGLTLDRGAIDTLGVSVSGTRGDHEVAVRLRSERSSVVMAAVGGIADATWAGNLVTASLVDSTAGRWRLEQPTRLQLARDGVIVADQACAVSDGAKTCVAGSWLSGGRWSLAATAQSLPLARFNPLLPPTLSVVGTLDAAADFKTTELGTLEGIARITSTFGNVNLRLRTGEQTLAYERGSVEITADPDGVSTSLAVVLRQPGITDSTYADVAGRLALPRYRPLLDSVAQQPIEGRMRMWLSDLSWAEAIFPQLAAVSGNFNLDFTVGGTVAAPQLAGEARLAGSADVPRLGLELRNAEFSAVGEGVGGIRLGGSLESGSGRLEAAGRLNAGSASDSALELRISGTRVQAANTPEAQVWISPDLDIVTVGRQLSVSGEVLAPRAQIELREIPAVAVPVSRDVILVGDTVRGPRPMMDIRGRVRLVLGDSVSFRGFGLTGQPTGSLLAVDEPGQVTTATGQLSIQQGRYRAYGQDLTIETGRVIYAGGPIDNPGLEIRAVRQARDDVTAGLNVAGTLKAPEVTVFSEPPMMQSEALAYLLLGRPLSELSQSEGSQLSSAAASLGLRGGNILAQRIARSFGIDEARIEMQGAWDEASFYAGKYLSPRLYVSYGIGLFDASSLFRIRYVLARRWTLQAETGERTSTDITYKIERGR